MVIFLADYYMDASIEVRFAIAEIIDIELIIIALH